MIKIQKAHNHQLPLNRIPKENQILKKIALPAEAAEAHQNPNQEAKVEESKGMQ